VSVGKSGRCRYLCRCRRCRLDHLCRLGRLLQGLRKRRVFVLVLQGRRLDLRCSDLRRLHRRLVVVVIQGRRFCEVRRLLRLDVSVKGRHRLHHIDVHHVHRARLGHLGFHILCLRRVLLFTRLLLVLQGRNRLHNLGSVRRGHDHFAGALLFVEGRRIYLCLVTLLRRLRCNVRPRHNCCFGSVLVVVQGRRFCLHHPNLCRHNHRLRGLRRRNLHYTCPVFGNRRRLDHHRCGHLHRHVQDDRVFVVHCRSCHHYRCCRQGLCNQYPVQFCVRKLGVALWSCCCHR
ncbi:hypothetical protein HK405_015883, partial [Cladochytrium tenue]